MRDLERLRLGEEVVLGLIEIARRSGFVAGLDETVDQELAVFGDGGQVCAGDVVLVGGGVRRNVEDVVGGIAAVGEDIVNDRVAQAVMMGRVVEYAWRHSVWR